MATPKLGLALKLHSQRERRRSSAAPFVGKKAVFAASVARYYAAGAGEDLPAPPREERRVLTGGRPKRQK